MQDFCTLGCSCGAPATEAALTGAALDWICSESEMSFLF